MRKLNGLSLGLCIAVLCSGCGELKEGIIAYHMAEFPKAISKLKKIAGKAAKKEPSFKLSVDSNTTLEEALPEVSRDYFAAWEAYAGSHFGLMRDEEGCKWVKTALRPIKLKVNGKTLSVKADPRQGAYWQSEVMSLRAWEINIPCL
jgi:hypothetical protein